MDPVFALHPELHGIDNEPISAPIRRSRYLNRNVFRLGGTGAFVRDAKSLRLPSHRYFKGVAGFHRLALLAGPGA
jgi:hypothetical protein